MTTIQVNAEHTYNVVIGCEWKSELLALTKNRSRVAVIYSTAMREMIRFDANAEAEFHFFEVSDGESAKNVSTLSSLWNWLGAAGFTRSDVIVGIGGGAITDLSGFAAATWLRGIDWIAIPTSVAGMVDASVGGKTGINSDYGKNLIGAFHSPISVLIDLDWLPTLSDRDFSAGMAEVIKSGFIKDGEILTTLAGNSLTTLRSNLSMVSNLIARSVHVKADVVGEDFKESFAREVLNYGHTLGHAIEIHSHYSLRHGEAVSIGLVYAAELAHARGLLSEQTLNQHRELLTALMLPISYDASAWPALWPLLALDKKTRGAQLRFVVIDAIGSTLRLEDLNESELRSAYERISA
ncbi:MAG: 3-dehydroquinate synthase [Actinobacteria bacterium]|uniref:3-dehydroquinate synthase n=1 Tax=freshwater metagenome TaxID=449393 RepID=A0A6J7PD58_9ZZZZ|nr:3-dehydroquinate synthase [Actinomycetota bacterium]MSV39013.1 3-dehydroquinate synthase [Actinomycetota bacterium]MSY48649.1 3-dehydroquinate synthase [Actinomycetota bacterium]MTH91496.1 3-dehydroquinate synthase [Actinomycetota bacterium]